MSVRPRRVRPWLRCLLAGSVVGSLVAVDAPRGMMDIAGLDRLDPDGVALATRGAVVRLGDRQVMADAARYDTEHGLVFLSGHVVYRQPGVRIAATRIGFTLPPGHRERTDTTDLTGDAWEVEAVITQPMPDGKGERTLRLRAPRVEFRDDRLIFRDVEVDLGHGGVVSFSAHRVLVTLRQPKPGEDPDELRSHVKGVEMISATGAIADVPVLWLPYLYRDFAHRYPWTKVRGGRNKRLGSYGRFWIGTDLPEWGDLHTGIDARVDDHSISGKGGGLRPYWWHPTLGTGDAEWYVLPSERVRGGPDQEEEVDLRRSEMVDVTHRVNLGSGAAYGRFTRVPAPDPAAAGASPVPVPPDYRFLDDYMPDRLQEGPLPRQGATATYGLPGGTATVDTERRIQPLHRTTERWYGLQLQAHPIELAGPLHLAADTWIEDLHRVQDGVDATRLRSQGYLALGQWFPGGLGVDADAGLRELRYGNGDQPGAEVEPASRRVPFSDAGLKLRLAADLGNNLTHTLIPRVGVQLIAPGAGMVLPSYGFGDPRDSLEEDARYYVTGLDTAVVGTRTLFHGNLTARWAMRDQERLYTDDAGVQQEGPSRLVDVVGSFDGSPADRFTITGSFAYDARPRRWRSFNAVARWRLADAVAIGDGSTLYPDPLQPSVYDWDHTPGVTVYASRYRADASVTTRPGGAPVDGWLIQLTRRMVEGDLFLGYQFLRNTDGGVSDRRVSIGLTIGGGAADSDAADVTPGTRGTLSR